MFGDIESALRRDLADREYAEEYATAYLNSFVATQIKVIREQRKMTQSELGSLIGTTQGGVSRIEDVNYSSWSMRTLMKLAVAFDVRLQVSFEPYGTLPGQVVRFDRQGLERVKRTEDPGLCAEDSKEKSLPEIVDIGLWRALAGSGQHEDTLGGLENGGTGNYKSESSRLDRDRFSQQQRPDTNVGLYSAAYQEVRFPEISLQA